MVQGLVKHDQVTLEQIVIPMGKATWVHKLEEL